MATLSAARRLVVKIGSALLVEGRSGRLRDAWLRALAEDVAALRARGTDVMIVSSGSIALGRGVLGLAGDTLALEHSSQAAAAVGQIRWRAPMRRRWRRTASLPRRCW
jgi:glutamate 5-kinase